jgi:hypothetical protein
MKPLVCLTADYANVSHDGKLNIMGVFNLIFSQVFPARHSTFFLVTKLVLELGEERTDRKLEVFLLGEDANEFKIKIFERVISFESIEPGAMPENQGILGLRDLVFPDPGTYQFVLHVDGHFLASTPVYLKQIPPQLAQNSPNSKG